MHPAIALERRYCAPNCQPLPIVLTHGEGFYVWDVRAGPDNLLRGSVPSSRHMANSPQGLKDGKA